MRRRDVSKVILASAAGSMLSARPLKAQGEDSAGGPRTRAEVEAGVTPADSRFPAGDVRRYGARGDGVSDDAPAFQHAIDVARRANHGPVFAPTGAAGSVSIPPPDVFYLLGRELDCTFDGRANQHGLAIRADTAPSSDSPAIIARHGGNVFDLTGCNGAVLENLNVGTDASVSPATCFLLARNRSGSSSGYHRFCNVRVHGKFRVAILYNYGSESNVYSGSLWCNESDAAGSKVAVFSSHNIFGLSSSFIAMARGSQSTLDHQILGGNFLNTSADAAADVLYLDTVSSLKIFGPWMAAGVHSPGRALIYVDSTHGASSVCEIYGLQGEVGRTQQYGCYFGGEGPSTPTGWSIDGCYLPNTRYAVYCAPETTLDRFHVSNLGELAAHGLSAAGVVQNSTISSGAMPLSIGISRANALIGDSSRWNIGKREHDCWLDSGATNKTWAPATEALRVSGRLAVENASCVFHGPLVTLSATLTASSLECAAGAALGGLPAPAIAASALVQVCDADSGAQLGSGLVRGTHLLLPRISARRSVVISASYFAA